MTGSCSPIRMKSRAFRTKTRISQTASPCTRVCAVVSSDVCAAHVDADGDRGQDGRDVRALGRQVGEVPREERDRDLERRVVEPPAQLADQPADAEADRDAAEHARHEREPGVHEREAAGHDGRDGEAVGDERRPVVDQALALDDRDEPPRHAEPARDRRRRHRIAARRWRRARRPRPAVDRAWATSATATCRDDGDQADAAVTSEVNDGEQRRRPAGREQLEAAGRRTIPPDRSGSRTARARAGGSHELRQGSVSVESSMRRL